ncbi:Histamine N-methyltransferase A [Holothuria leucospilota]|uniref:Histamine N-methyltransferase A n=1 Tax=Holothuria leucospilota TaxID=206669 RepID=A0A9Q1BK54_HOLLE|nr:Histamine N-methyltransferase A [Holothuria leucospilota]
MPNMDISFLEKLDPMSPLYFERFDAFKSFTDQKKRILEWISDRFEDEIVSHLLGAEVKTGNVTLSVLGIGSGDGKAEVKMLMHLMKKFRLVEFTVVEPSADEITSFKKLVEEQKKALNGVTFHWRQESLQDFCKANADGSKRFHFVSALHSLYFIQNKDLDFYLKTIFGWTEGKMLIMQGAVNSIFSGLDKGFPSTSNPLRPFKLGNKIEDSLKTLGISFETSVIPSECDITCCFDSDSRDGKLLLDFFLHVVRCGDNGPPQLLKMIKEYLNTEGISYTRHGRLYAPVPTQVIIASTSKRF